MYGPIESTGMKADIKAASALMDPICPRLIAAAVL
jgi:hypothetical protein